MIIAISLSFYSFKSQSQTFTVTDYNTIDTWQGACGNPASLSAGTFVEAIRQANQGTIDNIVFTIPLYNPFQSLYTYNGMIKVKDTLISIDYFKGEKYPLVQPTKIYHSKKKKGKWLYSKKIIPLFKDMINDTLVVYSDTSFDGKLHIKDSIKIVIHDN